MVALSNIRKTMKKLFPNCLWKNVHIAKALDKEMMSMSKANVTDVMGKENAKTSTLAIRLMWTMFESFTALSRTAEALRYVRAVVWRERVVYNRTEK